ncbi:MAG TPA: hypothetical protein VJB65_00505 [Patescibacteria group bacterium]|nr:hypothetical protein [Patescibacteria group bacterium]
MNKINVVAATTLGWVVASTPAAFAQINTAYPDLNKSLGSNDPVEIVTSVINIVLSVLAIIAVIFILVGGFQWLTAAGNDEKVKKAQKTIVAAVIGLLIIMASWGTATWVLANWGSATGTETTV